MEQKRCEINSEYHRLAVPVGLPKALIGIYEVRLQLQRLFECLNGFLTRENTTSFHTQLTGNCNREHVDRPKALTQQMVPTLYEI